MSSCYRGGATGGKGSIRRVLPNFNPLIASVKPFPSGFNLDTLFLDRSRAVSA